MLYNCFWINCSLYFSENVNVIKYEINQNHIRSNDWCYNSTDISRYFTALFVFTNLPLCFTTTIKLRDWNRRWSMIKHDKCSQMNGFKISLLMTLIRHLCFDLPLNRCFYWIWWMCNKCFFHHEVFCLRRNCRLSDYTLGYIYRHYDEFSNQVHVSCTNMYSNTASVSKDLLITNLQHYWHFEISNQISCKDIRFPFFTFKDVSNC